MAGVVKKGGRIFYGWWVLLAASVLQLYGAGTNFYGFGVFFKPMVDEFGWSRAATAAAFSLSRVEEGLEAPIVGFLVDRIGPRKLVFGGALVAGLGFILMYYINSLWMFYLIYAGLMSLGFRAAFGIPTQVAIANWFIKKRTMAFAIYSVGTALGGAIIVPILGVILGLFGWRTAAVMVGIGFFVIGPPMALLLRHRPEQYGYLPDGEEELSQEKTSQNHVEADGVTFREVDFTLGQALRTSSFWFLSVGLALRFLGQSAVVVHQIAYLTDVGISSEAAAAALGLLALISIPGRLGFGWLGDRFEKRLVLISTYILQAIGVFILAQVKSMSQVWLFLVVFGLGYGGAVPVFQSIRADYFGRKSFGVISGLIATITTVGTVSGPIFAGFVYDVAHSYYWAFMTFSAAYLLGAVILFFARPPKAPDNALIPKAHEAAHLHVAE